MVRLNDTWFNTWVYEPVLLGDIVEARQILPVDFTVIRFLVARALGARWTGIEKAQVGVVAQFAQGMEADGLDAIEPFLFGELSINGQMGLLPVQIGHR